MILADGCSSAPDSDLGARLLVLNARRLLSWFALPAVDEAERTARHWRLGRRLVRRAARQARELGVSVDVLDATLLVAWCEGSTVYIHCYGDGCIAVCRADGETAVIQIEYAENALPLPVLSAGSGPPCFVPEAIGDPAIAQTIRYSSKAGVSTRLEPFNSPTLFNFNLMTSPTVTVATDGLHSLVSTETGNRLNVLSVAQAMLDFDDHLEPGFIKRQLRQVLADYGQQRVFNLDDLSLGVFVGGN